MSTQTTKQLAGLRESKRPWARPRLVKLEHDQVSDEFLARLQRLKDKPPVDKF